MAQNFSSLSVPTLGGLYFFQGLFRSNLQFAFVRFLLISESLHRVLAREAYVAIESATND